LSLSLFKAPPWLVVCLPLGLFWPSPGLGAGPAALRGLYFVTSHFSLSLGEVFTAPSPKHTIQFIEFTYCHDRFPEQALTHKHAKYDPLNNTIQNNGWKINPLITITAGVRGAIHEHSIEKLTRINIPKSSIKKLMKDIHQNAIKYLTYLVLNKRKLDNKQNPVPLPN
jgi:hypothetical protein